jgi:hypothetical protein
MEIITRCHAISIAGQASIDKVAGPVGEALIMTHSALRSPFRSAHTTIPPPPQGGDGNVRRFRRRAACRAAVEPGEVLLGRA